MADVDLSVRGEAISDIPMTLLECEIAYTGVRHLRVVGSMHARKVLMSALSNGFIALPGRTGKLEEFLRS